MNNTLFTFDMRWAGRAVAAGGALLAALAASAQVASGLPLRNLAVEFRQIDASGLSTQGAGANGRVVSSRGGTASVEGGVTLSSRTDHRNLLVASQVRVVNGGRASVRITQTVPVQWVQAVDVRGGRSHGHSPRPPGSGASVVHGLTWLEAGRALVVRPRWPGGDQAATVELEAEHASLDDRTGQPLPGGTSVSQTSTTVLAPLGEWVTIATTSSHEQQSQHGVLSSSSAQGEQQQALQLRVSLP